MKYLPILVLNCGIVAAFPIIADAKGTYYNGNYQSPQMRYNSQSYTTRVNTTSGYNRSGYTNNGFSSYANTRQTTPIRVNVGQRTNVNPGQNVVVQTAATTNQNDNSGFWIGASFARETSKWQFDMKEAGSILHYDNVDWNVFNIDAGYDFDLGNATLGLVAGFRYGMQSGETAMIDDDVTNGGYLVTSWVDTAGNQIGEQIGHALSIGKSSDGSMLGFNIGLGIKDSFKLGVVKITPSIGYRYLKYKLETKNNHGLSVDTAACFTIEGSNEVQCDPAIIINYDNGTQQILWRDSISGELQISSSGAESVDTGGTYYYQQPGLSHSYEVEWSGPYLALDMDFVINQYNAVNGHIELGLPSYNTVGDQPYRIDWQHPKSVEDKAGIGDAFHFGLGASWTTAITNTVSLTVGMTYDYYTVSSADASTYLNSAYYDNIYNLLLNEWAETYPDNTEKYMLGEMPGVAGDPVALNIKDIESSCPGWVCQSDGEIESFYKSLGVRVGVQAKF